jgi:pimeloyl-ACP methyl ester carboxylesterase
MRTERQTLPGLVLHEHEFQIPLDHAKPEGEAITVFAREVTTPDKEGKDLPWLLFLQGGPGFPSPRPMDVSGWLGRAVDEFRVVLLDQRGTGRSTPVTRESLARFAGAQDQADYLALFRSDSIVRDAEHIRRELGGDDARWTLLGQSYGGFCSVQYLSSYPGSLEAVLITGGVPGIEAGVDEIYRLTYRKLIEKNRLYYERYPRDVERIREIAAYLAEYDVRLPGGDRLSVRGFQTLGLSFGMSDGYEKLHYLVDEAFVDGPEGRQLGYDFLRGVENYNAFDTNPIFSVLHEPIYGQEVATGWCAASLRSEFPEFDSVDGPLHFTCEMIFPWMFEEWSALSGMSEAADLLAQKSDWPVLYDPVRLEQNTVPVAAAVYHDDVYVPVELSLGTLARIPNARAWVTNEYEHNGLRADGPKILGRLLDMVRGKA